MIPEEIRSKLDDYVHEKIRIWIVFVIILYTVHAPKLIGDGQHGQFYATIVILMLAISLTISGKLFNNITFTCAALWTLQLKSMLANLVRIYPKLGEN